ncbi:hypothetical protein AVEN_20233-1 [Araneus ventricosus]|uniref:Transposase Tc1-like domain-containing protein n=1 Tax=Araneus ventricosus TaxID=182803 RepID=A0A4Y2CK86_ARAVE|nr:hypothetical protein AVEN_20233-1 [Araneus ventricosus]
MGFRSRRTTIVPLLTTRHKALCIARTRQHSHWTADDWKHVAWSDESRFQLYWADGRVRGTVQSGGASVMVCCAVGVKWTLTRLETVLTGDRYNHPMITHTHLMFIVHSTDCNQHDNATPHSQDLLRSIPRGDTKSSWTRSRRISKRVLASTVGEVVELSYLHSNDRTVPLSGVVGPWPMMATRIPTLVPYCCRDTGYSTTSHA